MTLPGLEPEEPGPTLARAMLTDEQEQAVARRAEPLLVSAAAGSGKTSVLVERFVRAVREDGVAPAKILAITFTERAAGEVRARVRARLLELGDRGAARDTEAAFVGTFHGFCARLLRAHPVAAGLDPEFAIIDEGVATRLRGLAFTTGLRELLADGRPEVVDLLAAYGVDRLRATIEQVHAELRSRGHGVPRLPSVTLDPGAAQLELDAAHAVAIIDELLERFGRVYELLKEGRAMVDFDDLELCSGALLTERPALRAAWAERFELLMVDEFQDTNPRQLAILAALDRGNLFTVGDEHQSIYGFRHADVRLFRARREQLQAPGASLALTRNFRSRKPLLDVVNALFGERLNGYTPLLAARADGQAAAGSAAGSGAGTDSDDAVEAPLVELLLTDAEGWEQHEQRLADGLPDVQRWRQAEARMLAQRIRELIDGGVARPGEIVVLLRATGDIEVFERALQLGGLRTLAAVGAFWQHQQVGDLIAYLRALANPLDEEAFYGALASPLAGCSRDALALLAEAAREQRRGAWRAALALVAGDATELAARLSVVDRERLQRFCSRLRSEREDASMRSIAALIERAIAHSGYREHVLGLDWGERRLANAHKLLRLARRFEAAEGRDLRAFLDHVAHLRESTVVEPEAPVEGAEPDAVRLMTVHAAKGLEFPVVCLADLGRQPNTKAPDLLLDGERVGLRLARLDGERATPALAYRDLAEERRARDAEEEDRILYVAMTRARERLLLSGAIDFERWPRSRQAPTPISWLAPALAAELPELARAGVPRADLTLAAEGSPAVRCLLNSPVSLGEVLRLPEPGAHPAVLGAHATADGSALAAGGPPSPAPQRSAQATGAGALVAPAARPSGADQISAVSYSSLSELARCGYRYYLERVLGLPEDRTALRAETAAAGLEARARGTLVHRLLESLDFSHPAAPSAEQVARHARELGIETSGPQRQEIASLIASAAECAPARRAAHAQWLLREHPFAFALDAEQPLVTGVIDLLACEREQCMLVLDYKSDRVARETDLGALVEREYGLQRLIYALAVLRDGASSVDVVHWFLERPQEPVSAVFDASERGQLEQRLASRLALARGAAFAVSPRPHRGLCLTCPGRAALCSWGEHETLREQAAGDADGAGARAPAA